LRQHLLAALPVCAESYLDTMELLDFRLQNGFDEGNLPMGTGPYGSDWDAKSLDDPFLIWGHDKGTIPGNEDKQRCYDDVSEAA
jgi:hypothetical protein